MDAQPTKRKPKRKLTPKISGGVWGEAMRLLLHLYHGPTSDSFYRVASSDGIWAFSTSAGQLARTAKTDPRRLRANLEWLEQQGYIGKAMFNRSKRVEWRFLLKTPAVRPLSLGEGQVDA